jgi:hypothetical protein
MLGLGPVRTIPIIAMLKTVAITKVVFGRLTYIAASMRVGLFVCRPRVDKNPAIPIVIDQLCSYCDSKALYGEAL